MGWFTNRKPIDDQTKPLSKASRKQCWDSRDSFFACLDKIGVENALDPENAAQIQTHCAKQESTFNNDCATSWIKYFKEKRVVDIKRERMIAKLESEGAQRVDLGYVGSAATPPSHRK
ncbi:Coa6p Ecym_1497 [Eremothecium cymbalariae DBVPG|uniref:Cytochrome c oxidase assembly factor 6 n=1 Tax=Eremothecium cymbalariae (strain CBS 270.75 / DBVPG 7215 / KCTC 17166 / NRRL Y-17582) TaxID=931890 RepID=G8JMQ6_ERECY|nr:hypothetical protein Ecym_1497 [Eremothecium cymbalariae DBVPG\